MQRSLLGITLALALGLAACAGPGASRAQTAPKPAGGAAPASQGATAPGPFTPNGEATASSGRVGLQMTDNMRYGPNLIRVKSGQAVSLELKNAGLTIHNLYAPSLGIGTPLKASGGQSATASFTAPAQPGSYAFWCNEPGHAEAGMTGRVIVE
jgi:plastocyanin